MLIFSSLLVIICKNPVNSLLFLVLSFLLSSFLLFLLECEFLAFIFIIIYVGAIAVLFLFSVMMLESKKEDLTKNSTKHLPVSILFIIVFFIFVQDLAGKYFRNNNNFSNSFYVNIYKNWGDLNDSINDIYSYGQILYSYFILQFLISGLILLLVLIGVVHITSFSKKCNKTQSALKQLSRQPVIFFGT